MKFKTISPIDGRVYVEQSFATIDEIRQALGRADEAKAEWKATPIRERARYCTSAVDAFVAQSEKIAEELAWQVGRPLQHGANEVNGFEERARFMINIASEKLADIQVEPKDGFTRFIRREPLGLVLVLAPWNYPYLTAVNSIVPALMAGNVVILKHAFQTPLCAERLADAFRTAGLPDNVFQYVHATHEDVGRMIMDDRVNFVAFTGSVEGGYAVQEAASQRFVGIGLELGGKDPAYVRADADINFAIENLVDGAMYNSGQSCCAVERIYVDRTVFDQFVDGFVDRAKQYKLGDPLDPETTLGPVVHSVAAEEIRYQIAEAIEDGAKALIDENLFEKAKDGTPYVAPQVLIDVNHSMRIMIEETFGPVVGIMPVDTDEEAISLMNDSAYGLTASVWTQNADAVLKIGEQIVTGTVFMNRCDYLDPALAWTGVKYSGNGVSLSELGYEQLTQPKSFHLRTKTS